MPDLPLCLGVFKHRALLARGNPSSWQKNEFTIDFCLCGTILNLKVFCFGAIPDRIIELMNVVQKVTGQKTDTFFMDGTFDTAPPLFKQIFTIRIAFSTTHITAVYCLLQKKARVGYQELFQTIIDKCEELGLTLNVTKVVSDSEDGLLVLRATNAVFGRQVEHQGCTNISCDFLFARVKNIDCDFLS